MPSYDDRGFAGRSLMDIRGDVGCDQVGVAEWNPLVSGVVQDPYPDRGRQTECSDVPMRHRNAVAALQLTTQLRDQASG